MSADRLAAAFTDAVRYAAADNVGENHAAMQKAMLVGNSNWWKEYGRVMRDGQIGISAKRGREIGRQRVGHDALPALVYADYLDEIGHPAARVFRLHHDEERQRIATQMKQRGMFFGESSWPRPDGLGWSIGTSTKNSSHPLWAHVDFQHEKESLPEGVYGYGRVYAPLTLEEAKQLADDHEAFYGPNGFVDEMRQHIARIESPRGRRPRSE